MASEPQKHENDRSQDQLPFFDFSEDNEADSNPYAEYEEEYNEPRSIRAAKKNQREQQRRKRQSTDFY